jgi:hypothetical protein
MVCECCLRTPHPALGCVLQHKTALARSHATQTRLTAQFRALRRKVLGKTGAPLADAHAPCSEARDRPGEPAAAGPVAARGDEDTAVGRHRGHADRVAPSHEAAQVDEGAEALAVEGDGPSFVTRVRRVV